MGHNCTGRNLACKYPFGHRLSNYWFGAVLAWYRCVTGAVLVHSCVILGEFLRGSDEVRRGSGEVLRSSGEFLRGSGEFCNSVATLYKQHMLIIRYLHKQVWQVQQNC